MIYGCWKGTLVRLRRLAQLVVVSVVGSDMTPGVIPASSLLVL